MLSNAIDTSMSNDNEYRAYSYHYDDLQFAFMLVSSNDTELE